MAANVFLQLMRVLFLSFLTLFFLSACGQGGTEENDASPVNIPVAQPLQFTTTENVSVAITLQGKGGAAPLRYQINKQPEHGSIEGTLPDINYVPAKDFQGQDEFTYTVSDSTQTSAQATVRINIKGINGAPVAQSLNIVTNFNTATDVSLQGTDPDADTLQYIIVSAPEQGSLTGTSPELRYTPNNDFYGSDTLTYKVSDGHIESAVASVNIRVNSPVLVAQTLQLDTAEDNAVAITLQATGGIAPLQYQLSSSPQQGQLSGTPPQLHYLPAPNFQGTDSFRYSVSDSQQTVATATVTITVTPVNDSPVAATQTLQVQQTQTLTIQLGATDIDTPVSQLTYNIVQNPQKGLLQGSGAQRHYTPNDGSFGTDSFHYSVSDGEHTSVPAIISITVIANDSDRDGDGVNDTDDRFPDNPNESTDLDNDGIGDNSDPDKDGDGVDNATDVFPEDGSESTDLDNDGIGDNSDPDRDGDGVNNDDDYFPDDPNASRVPTVTIVQPTSLITVGSSPITINGTLDDPNARLTVNGVPVVHSNGQFAVEVALEEGANTIIARAIDNQNHEGLATISVSLDKTPPQVTVQAPVVGQTVYTDRIAVSGLVNDIVRGAITEDDAVVNVNGITATVANRFYLAENVPLVEGVNTITVTASDAVGNIGNHSITVTYAVQHNDVISLVSGQAQNAPINTTLEAPLRVKLTRDEQPVADKTVIFRVIEGDGVLQPGSDDAAAGALVQTDANGEAQVSFQLGSRAGQGNHRVRARAVGFTGETIFHASASYGTGDKIGVIAGNNQRGSVRQPLPQPMVVAVTDTGANLIPDAEVEFSVSVGSGAFANGETSYRTKTDKDGRAVAQFTLGSETGLDRQRIAVSLLGTAAVAGFTASGFVPDDPGKTRINGVVLDNQDQPLENVTLRIEGTTREAVTDAQGQFTITEAPVGPVHLLADGSTTTREGEWPTLSYALVTVPGVLNPLSTPIYLVELNTQNAVSVGGADTTLILSEMPGFSLKVKAGSVTFPDGSKQGKLSVTAVNANKIPMPPPNGMQPQFIVTIQPHGARFDPPAELTLPNVDGHLPGAEVEMYSYDHDLEEFVTIGLGTVNKEGTVITSNPGVGVIKAGWHCGSQPGGSGCCEGGSTKPDCDECEALKSTGSCPTTYSCEPKPDSALLETQVPGNCQKETCGGNVPDDGDTPPKECGICKNGNPEIDGEKPLAEQKSDDCKELLCSGDSNPKDETKALQAKKGNECKICKDGSIADVDGNICDDGLFCTSASGTKVGQDICKDGSCVGKEIALSEDLSGGVNYDLSGLKKALSSNNSGSSNKFCDFGAGLSFSGGIKVSSITECCESKKAMVDGTGYSGTATLTGAKVSCNIPAFNWGLAQIGVTAGASIGGSFTGSGYQTPCEENCDWGIGGTAAVDLEGGLYMALIHPDVLSVSGTLSGGGRLSVSKSCDKPWSGAGCIGPPSVNGKMIAGGWYQKQISYQFNDLIMCSD